MDTTREDQVGGLTTLLKLTVILWTAFFKVDGIEDYCLTESFVASCAQDEVIVMDEAWYGRMQNGRCITQNYGHIGCSKNVLHLADRKCGGRRECQITIPNEEFEQTHPCPGDIKNYFEVNYHCEKVVTAAPGLCETSRYARVSLPRGNISSLVTANTGCGATVSPWLLEAEPGRSINLTLIDFAWHSPDGAIGREYHSDFRQCFKYGFIRDMATQQDITLCENTRRRFHLYKSISNTVELELTVAPAEENARQFLIEFEVVGCPDVKEPENGYSRRNGDVTVIGCYGYDGEWTLRCIGSEWTGDAWNCTPKADQKVGASTAIDFTVLSQEVSVIIIVLTAVVITFIILVAGYLCLKGKSLSHSQSNQQSHYDVTVAEEFPPSKSEFSTRGPYPAKPFNYRDTYAPPSYDTNNEYAVISDVIPERRVVDYNTPRSLKAQSCRSYDTPQYFELDSRDSPRHNTDCGTTNQRLDL